MPPCVWPAIEGSGLAAPEGGQAQGRRDLACALIVICQSLLELSLIAACSG